MTSTKDDEANTKWMPLHTLSALPVIILLLALPPTVLLLCRQRRKRSNIHPSHAQRGDMHAHANGYYEVILSDTNTQHANENDPLYSSINNYQPVNHPPSSTPGDSQQHDLPPPHNSTHEAATVTESEMNTLYDSPNNLTHTDASITGTEDPTYNTLDHRLNTRLESSHQQQEGSDNSDASGIPQVAGTTYSTVGTVNRITERDVSASGNASATENSSNIQMGAALYSTVDKARNRENYHMITAESLVDEIETGGSDAPMSDAGATALYSTVDKTRNRENYHMITAESSVDPDMPMSDAEVAALYSTVDKTRKRKNHHMTAESLADETDKPSCVMSDAEVAALYSTVDKARNRENYHMITAESLADRAEGADELMSDKGAAAPDSAVDLTDEVKSQDEPNHMTNSTVDYC